MKILFINATVWAEEGAAIETLIKNAGHEIVTDTESNVSAFLLKLKTSFPDVYSAIKTGIADLKDSTLTGGEKAVKVAEDALAVAPAVISDISGIKDAFVAAVTTFYASEVSDFKSITAATIAGISADVEAGIAGTETSVGTDTTTTAAAPAATTPGATTTTTSG